MNSITWTRKKVWYNNVVCDCIDENNKIYSGGRVGVGNNFANLLVQKLHL